MPTIASSRSWLGARWSRLRTPRCFISDPADKEAMDQATAWKPTPAYRRTRPAHHAGGSMNLVRQYLRGAR